MQPTNNNGSIIIRFSKFGYNYKLGKLGNFTDSQSLSKANEICSFIETDIKSGRFTARNNDELFTAYHPLAKLLNHHELNSFTVDAVTLVENHIKTLVYKDKVLLPCLSLLKNYGKQIKTKEDADKFFTWLSNDGKRSANSSNRYLQAIKPICPMFADVKSLKGNQAQTEKPFTKSEIKAICDVFDNHFPHYSAFIKFLFSTGCRTSEAVALRWDNVNFDSKTITISDSVGIANDGSKVRKGTKTGVNRILPMSSKLHILLKTQLDYRDKAFTELLDKSPHHFTVPIGDRLVFPSVEGNFIDIGNFRARVWVKALEQASVPYRTLYNTRHTFCSHFLNETPDFIKLASITHGTKSGVQTLIKHYAHIVEKVSMPDMF